MCIRDSEIIVEPTTLRAFEGDLDLRQQLLKCLSVGGALNASGFNHGLKRGDFGYLGLIGSATKRARFDENQVANDVVLTPEELAFLDENLPVGAAVGGRY